MGNDDRRIPGLSTSYIQEHYTNILAPEKVIELARTQCVTDAISDASGTQEAGRTFSWGPHETKSLLYLCSRATF